MVCKNVSVLSIGFWPLIISLLHTFEDNKFYRNVLQYFEKCSMGWEPSGQFDFWAVSFIFVINVKNNV